VTPTAAPVLRLSKSRFTAGLQCVRQLWWRVHEPESPELVPDVVTQKLFDQGSRIGELARTHVPGGVLIDLPHNAYEERLAATKAAIDAGAPVIYEASFSADDVYAAVDILERTERGWRLIEVKSSLSAKDIHVLDAAIQAHVVARSGLDVDGVQIMHLNRACTAPDLSDLFVRTDVTRRVDDFLAYVPTRVEEMLRMLAGPLPSAEIGAHCGEPYTCPFKERCWDRVPEHHVTTMYLAGRRAWEWVEAGHETVADLPFNPKMSPVARRQWKAVRENRRIVEPGLMEKLEALPRPLAFLDFETVMSAVPRWPGDHPYTQIPAQFSVHKERTDGSFEHISFLAESGEDPRPAIARAVLDACEGAATILAYNMPFEKKCLERLSEANGVDRLLGGRVRWLVPKLVDLLPLVRDHVYDPAFFGKFGLKNVLPVLVPDLSYEDLAIQDGQVASTLLERLVFGELAAEERARLTQDVLAYCERDTWATVRLFEALEQIA